MCSFIEVKGVVCLWGANNSRQFDVSFDVIRWEWYWVGWVWMNVLFASMGCTFERSFSAHSLIISHSILKFWIILKGHCDASVISQTVTTHLSRQEFFETLDYRSLDISIEEVLIRRKKLRWREVSSVWHAKGFAFIGDWWQNVWGLLNNCSPVHFLSAYDFVEVEQFATLKSCFATLVPLASNTFVRN